MTSIFLQATATTLLLAVLLFSPPTTAKETVYDNQGNPLVAGSYYYAIPKPTQKGGGLTMFNNGPSTCPKFMVAWSTKGNGIPIRFSPQSPIANLNVYTSTSLNIAFKFLSPQPLCRRAYTTVWAVSTDNTVVLNGEEGRDDSLFTLEASTGGYKILFGDKIVLYDEKELLNIDNGNEVLVVFVKAKICIVSNVCKL